MLKTFTVVIQLKSLIAFGVTLEWSDRSSSFKLKVHSRKHSLCSQRGLTRLSLCLSHLEKCDMTWSQTERQKVRCLGYVNIRHNSSHLSRRAVQWRQRDKYRWSSPPCRHTLLRSDRAVIRIRWCLEDEQKKKEEADPLLIQFTLRFKIFSVFTWKSKRLLSKTLSRIKSTELPFWKHRVSLTRCLVLRAIPSHVDTKIHELCRVW